MVIVPIYFVSIKYTLSKVNYWEWDNDLKIPKNLISILFIQFVDVFIEPFWINPTQDILIFDYSSKLILLCGNNLCIVTVTDHDFLDRIQNHTC